VIKFVLIVPLSYILIMGALYFMQESMLYFPDRNIVATPEYSGLAYEEISVKTQDGVTISGWYIPSGDEKGVLLFCHGNAGNISHRLRSVEIFHSLGLSVLIFDYRGYGKSEGKPTESGTYLDGEAAWSYLVEVKGKSPARIILFGRSLGGAVAAEVALRKAPAGLIIESSFTSVAELGKKFYPWAPVDLIARYKYATIDKVGAITCPKLIIHSRGDELIPFDQGRKLYEKASPPKEFLEIRGGHNDGFLLSGETYREGLRPFLDKVVSTGQ